jgi:hypothetical protein
LRRLAFANFRWFVSGDSAAMVGGLLSEDVALISE